MWQPREVDEKKQRRVRVVRMQKEAMRKKRDQKAKQGRPAQKGDEEWICAVAQLRRRTRALSSADTNLQGFAGFWPWGC